MQSLELWAQLVEKSIQSTNVFSHSTDKWAHSTKGVHGERSGVNIDSVKRLWMRSNWKMKFMTFTHNDDVKCLHVAVQRTHKLVVMGGINFKDDA